MENQMHGSLPSFHPYVIREKIYDPPNFSVLEAVKYWFGVRVGGPSEMALCTCSLQSKSLRWE